jgi:hypothetical protein
MNFWMVAAAIGVMLLVYALWVRDWLKNKPWAKGFFARIEPIEIALYKKSATILVARLKMLTGLLLTYLTLIGGLDLAPLMPLVPAQYQDAVHVAVNMLPLVLTLIGMADERLRNKTTSPVALVAATEEEKSRPDVAEVIAAADAAKTEAVAVLTQAKEAA